MLIQINSRRRTTEVVLEDQRLRVKDVNVEEVRRRTTIYHDIISTVMSEVLMGTTKRKGNIECVLFSSRHPR